MIKKEVGECAGKIWNLLDTKGITSIDNVIISCDNNTTIVMLALGWLYRENKIIILTDWVEKSDNITRSYPFNEQQKKRYLMRYNSLFIPFDNANIQKAEGIYKSIMNIHAFVT